MFNFYKILYENNTVIKFTSFILLDYLVVYILQNSFVSDIYLTLIILKYIQRKRNQSTY